MQPTQDSPPDTTPAPPRVIEFAGWAGTLAILGAYAATSLNWMEQGRAYDLLNLGGAIGVGSICWYRRTWQAFALEAAWGVIALVSLAGS